MRVYGDLDGPNIIIRQLSYKHGRVSDHAVYFLA